MIAARSVLYGTVLLLACLQTHVTADWSRFRGPDGMGASDATGLPVSWSATEGIAWKTALPGAGASSPIVFGNHVYLTYYTGYRVPGESGGSLQQLKRHLAAVGLSDGRILWTQTLSAILPEESNVREHGYASSTPVADADGVYVFFGKSGVFAFDHEGRRLWHANVGSKTSGWGSGSSPVLHKDLVFINASVENESLAALDRRTGVEKWRVGGIREAWNTPVVVTAASGREELIVPILGKVLAFDPVSGKSLWSCKTNIEWYIAPSVVAADGVIYCLGGRSGVGAVAIRAGGSGDVTATHRLWTREMASNVSSPVYLNGHLYWGHDSRDVAYCVNAATGDMVYEQRLQGAGQFYASAVLADGRLYYVGRTGKIFVLAAGPQFQQLALNDLSDRGVFDASPAVVGNRLLIRSNKFLYCVGPHWNATAQSLAAYNPDPPDGDNEVASVPVLSWLPGQMATKHQVYVSDSLAAVSQGTAEANHGETNQTTCVPGNLEPATVYFWRVDAITAAGVVRPGPVWRFATFLPVDDFESYNDQENEGTRIFETWLDGWTNATGATVGYMESPFAERQFVHGGQQAMPLEYNNADPPYHSETERTFEVAQDWTAHDVNAIVLYVRGSATDQSARLYLGLEDTSGQAAFAAHPEPTVAAAVKWARWEIPLGDFPNVDLARVKKVYLGVGDRENPLPGEKGRLYVDDLRLVRSSSVP